MAEPWTSGAGPQESDQPYRPFDRRALEDTLADALRDAGGDGPSAGGRHFGAGARPEPGASPADPQPIARPAGAAPSPQVAGAPGLPLRRTPLPDPQSAVAGAAGPLPSPTPRPDGPPRPAPLTAPSSTGRPAPRPSLLGSGLIGAAGGMGGTSAITGTLGSAGSPPRGISGPVSGPVRANPTPSALRPPEAAAATPLRPPEAAAATPLRPPGQLPGISHPADLGASRLGSGLSTSGYSQAPTAPAPGEQATIPLRRPKRPDSGPDAGSRPDPKAAGTAATPPASGRTKAPVGPPAPAAPPSAAAGPKAQTARPAAVVTGWSPTDDDILPQGLSKRRGRRR